MEHDSEKTPPKKPAVKAKAKSVVNKEAAQHKAANSVPITAPEGAKEKVPVKAKEKIMKSASSAQIPSSSKSPSKDREKKSLNKGALALMLALTALTGAVGGSFGTDILHSMHGTSGQDMNSLDMNILADMEKQASIMQAKLERLERDLGQVKSGANASIQEASKEDQATLEKMLTELSDVQDKITQLEARPVAVTSASSGGEDSDGAASGDGVIAGDVYTRLENSETSLKKMQAQLDKQSAKLEQVNDAAAQNPNSTGGADSSNVEPANTAQTQAALTEMQTRLDQLESQMNAFNLGAPDTKEQITAMQADLTRLSGEVDSLAAAEPATLPLFPKDAVLEALAKDEADQPRGWLGRTMSKHIVVRDEAALAVLDEIDRDLEQGNVDAALSAIDRLPPSAQSAAADWKADVKALRHK